MRNNRFFCRSALTSLILIVLSSCTISCCKQSQEEEHIVRIAVFAVNDFHGSFAKDTTRDIPGAANFIETLDSLKKEYPHHVTIATGDNFGGSYFTTATKSELMPAFFGAAGIRHSVVGNHEFDNGQDFLAGKFSQSKHRPETWDITYLCANVKNCDDKQPEYTHPVSEYIQPSVLIPINLTPTYTANIGITGLITAQTPKQTRASNIEGLKFSDNYRETATLSKPNADINLLACHIGTRMENGRVVWDDIQGNDLNGISISDFHGIFTAHTHNTVCGKINSDSIPVLQGECNGAYISMMEIKFDTIKHQTICVIPRLVKVAYHDTFNPNANKIKALVDSTLANTRTDAGYSLGEPITFANEDLVHNRTNKRCFTEVATLVCESYAEAYKNAAGISHGEDVIGISHYGSIRSGLSEGSITVLNLGETLPFFNTLRVFRMTGEQIYRLVDFGLHNDKFGWLQTNNLYYLCDNQESRKLKCIYIVSDDGEKREIDKKKTYTVVADEYIVMGGDGYSKTFFPQQQEVRINNMPKSTDAFIAYLKTKSAIGKDVNKTNRITYEDLK